ncbi:MAG TPA: helix-turn-helix domain-containing protein [Bryobacteraceae bacterium]|nr:helix-turn-helix domain-containing protein [Bryobacteraceae bacterium]
MSRLVFLSELRDLNSGAYRAPTALTAAERAEVDRLLRRMHEEAFSTWLNHRLEEQEADLDLYFSGLDCAKAVAVQTWRTLESYRWLVPASAMPIERQLFFADLEALLELMANEMGLASGPASQLSRGTTSEALVTVRELSKWLRVSTRTIRFWAEVRELPAIKVGRHWRFPREAIREWLRRRGASA